jgi:hypothetical protein
MQSNSELANSWNIKQNSEEEEPDTDNEDNINESSSEETYNSNKSLTKYEFLQTKFSDCYSIFGSK